jgi:hypothetical protein
MVVLAPAVRLLSCAVILICTCKAHTHRVSFSVYLLHTRSVWRTVSPTLMQYEEPCGGVGEMNSGATFSTQDPALPPLQLVHVAAEEHTVSALLQSLRQRLSGIMSEQKNSDRNSADGHARDRVEQRDDKVDGYLAACVLHHHLRVPETGCHSHSVP